MISLVKMTLNSIKKVAVYAGNFGVSAIADISVFAIILFLTKPVLGTGISIVVASVFARTLSSLLNFKLNKELFIGDKISHRKCIVRYYILWTSLLVLSSSTIFILNDIFETNEIIAKIIADMSLGIFSYQVQMRWVFSEKAHKKTKGFYYRSLRKVVRLFVKREMMIDDTVFTSGNVLVAHHQNFYGPISCAIWLPDTVSIWAVSHLFSFKACFDMYYNFTFTKIIKLPKVIALPMATVCALFIPPLMRSGGFIPVYRGSRDIIKTFNLSMDLLTKGEQVLIFPDVEYNDAGDIIGEIYTGFTQLEKLYNRANKAHIGFVPIRIDKETGRITNTDIIYFTGDISYKVEKDIVAKQIIDNINLNLSKI